MADGNNLTVTHATETLGQSLTLQGDAAGCGDCDIHSVGHFTVMNDATLTLDKGIRLRIDPGSRLFVGGSTQEGHLVTNGGPNNAEWPSIRNSPDNDWDAIDGIVVEGPDGSNISSVSIDGLKINVSTTNDVFAFIANFSVNQMDDIDTLSWELNQRTYFRFDDCTNSTIANTWSNINFNAPFYFNSVDVSANIEMDGTNCDSGNSISVTVDGSGPGFGNVYEKDPNNVVSWTNGASFTCVWTGSTDTDWTKPSNWSGCTKRPSKLPRSKRLRADT